MATIIQLIGAGLVTTGVALIYLPAGLIVGGIFAILVGLSLERN